MTLDNKRIALYSFSGICVAAWYVLWRLFESILDLFLPGEIILGIPLANYMGLAAGAVTVVAGVLVWRNEIANRFSGEVVVELKKVTWPSWKELRGSTLIVIIMTLVISAILWLFDKILDFGMTALL